MKPNEALELLDRAASAAAGTRKDHALIQEAVAVLKAEISKPDPTVETPATP